MKRMIAVLLTMLLVCGMIPAQADEPDGYMATGGAIPDQQTYPGTWQQAYLQILNNHSAKIHLYQSRTLEYYADYTFEQINIPCRPVSLMELTGDGIPELIFLEVAMEERGDLYIYTSDGTTARCALYVPGIARLGYNDVDMRFDIYLSSNAGGTLVIEYYEYEKPWKLQLMRNALNQYFLLNYMTEDYDPSGEADDDHFYLNGTDVGMEVYDTAVLAMRNAKTAVISDYIAEDLSHFGLNLTYEEAVFMMGGTEAVTPEPTAEANTEEEIYGLTIDKLATRKGPGTQYEGGGTYSVKGQYIRVLARAYDKRNGIWWVKCAIPYKGEERILWTGYKRFDKDQLPLESIPIEEGW